MADVCLFIVRCCFYSFLLESEIHGMEIIKSGLVNEDFGYVIFSIKLLNLSASFRVLRFEGTQHRDDRKTALCNVAVAASR